MRKLAQPIELRGRVVPNRIVMPPMVLFKHDEASWQPDAAHLEYYATRARAGTGLVIVEATAVADVGRLAPFQLRAWDDSHIPFLASISQVIHAAGAVALIQIQHAGANTSAGFIGTPPVSPSGVKARRPHADEARALEVEEIVGLIAAYADAASRCVKAGFDGVELHGAHGYLLTQFLSPASNLRNDEWGGDSGRRLAFPLAVTRAVRDAMGPDHIVTYRLGAAEYIENGLPLHEGIAAAKALEATGCLDALNVSNGIGGGEWPALPPDFDFSNLMYLGAQVRKHVALPVIAVGGIRTGQEAEQALQAGVSDLIAVGSAMLADPEWSQKALADKDDELNLCLRCKRCGHFRAGATCPGKA